jgi:hypothetical protein
MYSEENKRNDEYIWASIFASELNKQHGFDYTLHPEHTEGTPVDMYLASLSGKYPQLEVQLTHAVELPFIAYEEPVTANYSKQPTMEAIERKFEKLTRQGADLTRLILLVQGYMSHEVATEVFAAPVFDKYKTYPFKGIYYAAPAMMSGDTNESLQEGYMIAIKDAF